MMIYLLKMMKTYGDFPLLGFKKKMRIIYYDHGTPQRVYGDDGTPHVVTWLAIGCYIPSGKHTKS